MAGCREELNIFLTAKCERKTESGSWQLFFRIARKEKNGVLIMQSIKKGREGKKCKDGVCYAKLPRQTFKCQRKLAFVGRLKEY